MGYITTFLHFQPFVKLPYPTYDFSNQTIIVSGANTGLGNLHSASSLLQPCLTASLRPRGARHFLRLNASKVVLAVRTISKGEAAASSLSTSLDCPKSRIEVWQVGLSSFESIKSFTKRVNTLDRLDAFVQNAGILTNNFSVVEGQESTIAVNAIGAVLLGLTVLQKLRESAAKYNVQGRLTFVGSDLQYIAKFKEKDASGKLFDALKVKEGADMGDRYRASKLLLLYAIRSIATRSPVSSHSNVIINYLTPGACATDIFRDAINWLQALLQKIAIRLIARTTEQGSRTIVHAVNPSVGEETHGRFLMDCKIFPNGDNVDSEMGRKMQKKTTKKLWAILEEISPGVTKF